MNELKIEELKKIFTCLDEARAHNLKDFPYDKISTSFNEKLKEFLKEHFKEDIQFDRKETFAYMQAHYKKIGIEINTYGGIIFTIEKKEDNDILKDFEPIFSRIMGSAQICKYNYCSTKSNTSYQTIEWNSHPEDRLCELVRKQNCRPGEYMRKFEDYYTASVIKDLGDNLFTDYGYEKIFKGRYYDLDYYYYIINQIRKVYTSLADDNIFEWKTSSRERLTLSKKIH